MNTKTEYLVETVGRRKTAIARVRAWNTAKQSVTINDKTVEEYFDTPELRQKAIQVLTAFELPSKLTMTVRVSGGGTSSQAEAVCHGIARAVVSIYPELRIPIKTGGFLKRDAREKERRKFGLKKARKRKQWSKR